MFALSCNGFTWGHLVKFSVHQVYKNNHHPCASHIKEAFRHMNLDTPAFIPGIINLCSGLSNRAGSEQTGFLCIVTRGLAHLRRGQCGSIWHSGAKLWALLDTQSSSTGRMWHGHRSSFIYFFFSFFLLVTVLLWVCMHLTWHPISRPIAFISSSIGLHLSPSHHLTLIK